MKTFETNSRRSAELNELYRRFAEEDAAQTDADLKKLLQLPEFRRVFAGIVKRSRVFGSISYDSVETNAVMKAVGFREMGVDVYMMANRADGEMVLKAIAERNDLERSRAKKAEALATKGN